MILILAAVPLETRLLRQQMAPRENLDGALPRTFSGTYRDQDFVLAHSGIGIVNMALAAQRLVGRHAPEAVFLVGCGGSYPNSALVNGDLVLADSEIYGDLGVETATEFLHLEGIASKNTDIVVNDVQNRYIFNKRILSELSQILKEATTGPCVTVNCCSGTPALAAKLEKRTGGLCENMEGAAAAQVCAQEGVPLIELRGISNPVGTRDPKLWDLVLGAETAQRGLLKILESRTP